MLYRIRRGEAQCIATTPPRIRGGTASGSGKKWPVFVVIHSERNENWVLVGTHREFGLEEAVVIPTKKLLGWLENLRNNPAHCPTCGVNRSVAALGVEGATDLINEVLLLSGRASTPPQR